MCKCAFERATGKTDPLATTGTTFGLALVVLEVLSTQFGTSEQDCGLTD